MLKTPLIGSCLSLEKKREQVISSCAKVPRKSRDDVPVEAILGLASILMKTLWSDSIILKKYVINKQNIVKMF